MGETSGYGRKQFLTPDIIPYHGKQDFHGICQQPGIQGHGLGVVVGYQPENMILRNGKGDGDTGRTQYKQVMRIGVRFHRLHFRTGNRTNDHLNPIPVHFFNDLFCL